MLDTRTRVVAESVFDRNKRREAEINEALKQEEARREAAVKNMLRLKALRMARDAKLKKEQDVVRSGDMAAPYKPPARSTLSPYQRQTPRTINARFSRA